MPPHFHIHIDAAWLDPAFEGYVTRELGFYRTDFVGPDGGKTEPLNHLTLRVYDGHLYREAFTRVVDAAKDGELMRGYIEGEYVAVDADLPIGAFNPEVPQPFVLRMKSLAPGTFRESELHIAMCAERSNPNLLCALHAMGLLTIYVPKSWGVSIVFTAQGSRREVSQLVKVLRSFLEAAGGAVECSIKEERIVNWWISPGEVSIPPILESVEWKDARYASLIQALA